VFTQFHFVTPEQSTPKGSPAFQTSVRHPAFLHDPSIDSGQNGTITFVVASTTTHSTSTTSSTTSSGGGGYYTPVSTIISTGTQVSTGSTTITQITSIATPVKLEYLGPYPLTPQLVATGTLQATAIVGNAGDETGNCTFALAADQTFMNRFTYFFLINNTQVRSFALGAGQRQIFSVNFIFKEATPVMNYNATISISAVPTSQPGIGSVASLSVPVWIRASDVTESPIWPIALVIAIGIVLVLCRRH